MTDLSSCYYEQRGINITKVVKGISQSVPINGARNIEVKHENDVLPESADC